MNKLQLEEFVAFGQLEGGTCLTLEDSFRSCLPLTFFVGALFFNPGRMSLSLSELSDPLHFLGLVRVIGWVLSIGECSH
jgi:hypothetical protein